jgi:multiple sugar transport system ATP-binding protein
MNFVPARLQGEPALAVALADDSELALPAGRSAKLAGRRGQAITLGVRPEHITRAGGELRTGLVRRTASIELVQPTGSRTYATFRLGGAEVVAELQAHDVSQPGETIELAIDMNRVVLIDPTTELVVS